MKICTKNKFLDTLRKNESIYACTLWYKSDDEWVANKLERIDPKFVFMFSACEVCGVEEGQNGYIVFSDNSRLTFDQGNNYTFYEHLSKSGIYFIVCRRELLNFNEVDYIAYAIPDLCINAGLKVQEAVNKITRLKNKCIAGKAKEISEFGNAENRNYFVQGLNKALEIIDKVFNN